MFITIDIYICYFSSVIILYFLLTVHIDYIKEKEK